MEKFLFRAVSDGSNKFVYGLPSYNEFGSIDKLTEWDFIHNKFIIHQVITDTISKYTQIDTHYRDGMRIYEGDVIEFTIPDERFWGELANTRKEGLVRYEPDYGGYIVEWEWSKNQHHVLLDGDVAFESIIIGNKWGIENDTLLDKLNNVDISDISYSGIVSQIQNDKNVAKQLLLALINDYTVNKEFKLNAENNLNKFKRRLNDFKIAVERVNKHMGYMLPLTIIDSERIIKINESFEIEILKDIL